MFALLFGEIKSRRRVREWRLSISHALRERGAAPARAEAGAGVHPPQTPRHGRDAPCHALPVPLSPPGAASEPKRSKERVFSALVTKQTSAHLVLYTHRALIPLTYNFIIFYY